jgi:hypothetical protein
VVQLVPRNALRVVNYAVRIAPVSITSWLPLLARRIGALRPALVTGSTLRAPLRLGLKT